MKEQLVTVRAIRGAVQVEANERTSILEATTELVTEVMARGAEEGRDDGHADSSATSGVRRGLGVSPRARCMPPQPA